MSEKSNPAAGGEPADGATSIRSAAKQPDSRSLAPKRKAKASRSWRGPADGDGKMLSAALRYAGLGLAVFPCGRDKRPYTENGFKDASTDARRIRSWWSKHPDAMIGMPTGPASGIDVLDIDVKNVDGFAALPGWSDMSPVLVRTPSGGAHVWFKSEGTIRNSVGKIAPGVDTRGEGGYVIVPPSQPNGNDKAYRWERGDETRISDLPPWPVALIEKLKKPKAEKAKTEESDRRPPPDEVQCGIAAMGLEATCQAVAAASEGVRNDTLNRAAFRLGQLVGGGYLDELTVVEKLSEAARQAGLDDVEIDGTIRSGLGAGKNAPRAPDAELADEIDRLAALPTLRYEQVRGEAADRLGIRVFVLDDAVMERRAAGNAGDDRQGSAVTLLPTEPWPEAVDGEALVAEIERTIHRHVILTSEQALTVALWAFHTHASEFAEHFPRLHIASPTKQCGKSRLLMTVALLVPKPLKIENTTMAAMFRVLAKWQPTLLIDEADSFLRRDGKDNDDIRSLLDSGHERGGGILRTVGEDFEPRVFPVWGPVAIAGIRDIPETVEDRSLTIHLRRKLPNESVERLPRDRTAIADSGRKIARWVADHGEQLNDADPALPETLGDRARDNWRPLIAIADAISPSLGERARSAALGLSKEAQIYAPDDNALLMLADVAAIFSEKRQDRLRSQTLVEELIKLADRPWTKWGRNGQGLTQNALARLLRPFGIVPCSIRFEPKPRPTAHGYELGPIAEAYNRYAKDIAPSGGEADF
jgi:hypothetical protein